MLPTRVRRSASTFGTPMQAADYVTEKGTTTQALFFFHSWNTAALKLGIGFACGSWELLGYMREEGTRRCLPPFPRGFSVGTRGCALSDVTAPKATHEGLKISVTLVVGRERNRGSRRPLRLPPRWLCSALL
ncbi:hypothetical protein BHE74_00051013 [Ensete ventricosum]|nr:hypothetical protein BHE74_00051013 [Ensete ventricosum]